MFLRNMVQTLYNRYKRCGVFDTDFRGAGLACIPIFLR